MAYESFPDEAQGKHGKCRAEFYLRPKPDKAATLAEGRPVFKMVEYIRISGGDLRNLPDKPAHEGHRRAYPREYAAFKAGTSQDSASGTLLSAWGGVSPERVEELRFFRIHTVEQLAEVPDGQLNQMGLHTRKERERARDYIKTAKGNAPVMQLRSELESRDARIAELERRLELMLTQQRPAEEAPPKRGPGRPPKSETSQAAE